MPKKCIILAIFRFGDFFVFLLFGVESVLKMNVLRSLFCSFSLVLLLRGKNIDYLHFSMSKIVVVLFLLLLLLLYF